MTAGVVRFLAPLLVPGFLALSLALRAQPASSPSPALVPTPSPTHRTTSSTVSTSPTFAFPPPGQVRVIRATDIDRLLNTHGKSLLVVNFWATWCAPCVAEIPHFVEVYNQFREKDVLFVGLSADFVEDWQQEVLPFLKDKKVTYPNFVLDVDPNFLIPKFSDKWGGELPATFFYDKDGVQLGARLGLVEKDELLKQITTYLQRAGGHP